MKRLDYRKIDANLYVLMNKINELVDEVVFLRKELERLEKVKAKKTITMGGMRES